MDKDEEIAILKIKLGIAMLDRDHWHKKWMEERIVNFRNSTDYRCVSSSIDFSSIFTKEIE